MADMEWEETRTETRGMVMGPLFAALAKAQSEIQHAKKDKRNPFFKSNYADLASVMDACRAALTKNGLAVIQTTEDTEAGLYLVTTLGHSSGAAVAGRMPIRPVKNDPQGVGSALTYARRYALAAIVGVATEDDDGNEASREPEEHETQRNVGVTVPPKVSTPAITPGSDQACPKCGSIKVGKQKYPKPGAEKFCGDCGAAF